MNTFEHTPNEQLYIPWETTFHEKIDERLAHQESTVDDLLYILWEYGILEHISPSDPDAYALRQSKNKVVFKRDDPALYDFLNKDLEKLQESIKNGKTIAGGFASVIINVAAKITTSKVEYLNIPKKFTEITEILIEKIIEKIKNSL